MSDQDIRWVQRFANYQKTVAQLTRFIEKGELNEFEKQGLIQSFEYNYELAWNTMKDFYEHQNEANIQGSRDTIRLAFKRGLIENGQVWMDMLHSRNQTAHTYNEETAEAIVTAIRDHYYSEFLQLEKELCNQKEKNTED